MLTNGNIIDYVLANRLFLEDGEYLTQERLRTIGNDAVGSARAWLWGRFFQAGKGTAFTEFTSTTFDDLIPADLAEMADIRSAYTALDVDADLFIAVFDALVQLSVANLWQASGQEESGKQALKEAKEMVLAIVGKAADPEGEIGAGGGASGGPLEAHVVIDTWTEAEITAELGGYE